MSTTTPYLGLVLYDSSTDQAVTFATFRAVWGGTPTTSNFYKIDTELADVDSRLTTLEGQTGAIPVDAGYVSSNYYEATPSGITSYYSGLNIILNVDTTSNGTVTLNINSLGTKSVMKVDSSGTPINLTGSDLVVGRQYLFVYDGTRWLWVSANSADQIQIVGTAGDVVVVGSSNNLASYGTPSDFIADTINGGTSKSTPVDADEIGMADSEASYAFKKLTLANLKTTIGGANLSSSSPFVYTSSDTWSKPSGLSYIIVEIVGGGGGGGGVAGNGSNPGCANGGGGGEYAKKRIDAGDLGSTETVTVGAGGAGGTAGNNDGSTGGTTSFGAHVTAIGGDGGSGQTAGSAQVGTPGAAAGGLGGDGGTGADVSVPGNPASWGFNTSTTSVAPSRGGGTFLSGGVQSSTAASSDEDGIDGVKNGCGGSGARSSSNATDRAGGTGADGVVIVWEYVS